MFRNLGFSSSTSILYCIYIIFWRTSGPFFLVFFSLSPPRGQCTAEYKPGGATQEAKYVERWPNTTYAWAGWSRFDIPVDRYGGVHSLLICTSSILGSPTCHQASQQENTYSTKYQKADRASTLCTLWGQLI